MEQDLSLAVLQLQSPGGRESTTLTTTTTYAKAFL